MDSKGLGDYNYPSRAETPVAEPKYGYPLQTGKLSVEQPQPGIERLFRALLLLTGVFIFGVIGYAIGYKVLFRSVSEKVAEERALAQVNLRLTEAENRLEKLEAERASPRPIEKTEKSDTAVPAKVTENTAQPNPKPDYKVIYQQPPAAAPPSYQHLDDIQKGLGALQDQTKANSEALQAASDRLANVAGQVDAEHGEILRSQEQLTELLARTERTPFAFELRRRSNPQPVGPVSLSLKSANLKKRRYTACVYVQGDCLELKDRSSYEVVQFSLSGDALPYQVIVTKISNDRIAGYLNVPRDKATH